MKKNFYVKYMLVLLLFSLNIMPLQARDTLSEKKVSLVMEHATLMEVLKELERQTQLTFFYSTDQIDSKRKIRRIHLENASLGDALSEIFRDTRTSYSISGSHILLRRENTFKKIRKKQVEINEGEINGRIEPMLEQQARQNEFGAAVIITISGKVSDENGSPVPGVNIIEKGTTNGTTTDGDGNYSIVVQEDDAVLVFSFIGYTTQEVSVNGRSVIDVVLVEAVRSLEEVVVVGYGTVKKTDLTGSIASVSSADFKSQPVHKLDQVLQGRVPGVQVTQTSGALDGSYKIRIRGSNSIAGNNDPLYVVDGFVADNLDFVNVNDIESMDILKDASATAIYGSRGANGVVLITTKKGARGPAKITFDTFHGFSNVVKKLDVMTPAEFAEGVNFADGTERFTQAEIDALRTGGGQDWQENVFDVARSSNYQLAVGGGNEKLDYYVSGNYYQTGGIVINQNFKRYLFRGKLNAHLSDKIQIGFNAVGSNSGTTGAEATLISALTFDMTTPPRDENGNYNLRSVKSDIGNGEFNPIVRPNEYIRETYRNDARADGYFDMEIIDNLTLNISGGIHWRTLGQNSYTPILTTTTGEAEVINTEFMTYQNTNRLTYVYDKINNHRLQFDVIHEQYLNTVVNLTATATGFLSDNNTYKNLELAEIQRTSNYSRDISLQSFLSRVNYSFLNKYLFTASVRADGSSKFRKDHRWGIFPSGSAAWRISEEAFMKNNRTINNLKLRLSYGVTGSQAVGALSTRSQPLFGAGINYPLTGGVYFTGLAPSARFANPELTWEETAQQNIGLDLGLWNSKITLSMDVYNKHTYDMLLDRIFPEFAGARNKLENVGELRNRGFEFNLGFIPLQTRDWSVNSNFTFSRNINEVLTLVDDQKVLQKGGTYDQAIEINPTRIEVGESISSFRGYIFDGVYQLDEAPEAAKYGRVPGNAKYKDLNNDGLITTEDVSRIGDGNPDFIFGWNTTVNWKNFDLNCFFTGTYGNDIYNLVRGKMMGIGVRSYHASHADYTNRWTPENPSNVPATRDRTFLASTQFLEDGSYVALKNVSLSYTFGKTNAFDKIGLEMLRLYGSIGNALILTDYKGYDPETTSTGNSDVDIGIDYGAYPLSRTFIFGVNVTF